MKQARYCAFKLCFIILFCEIFLYGWKHTYLCKRLYPEWYFPIYHGQSPGRQCTVYQASSRRMSLLLSSFVKWFALIRSFHSAVLHTDRRHRTAHSTRQSLTSPLLTRYGSSQHLALKQTFILKTFEIHTKLQSINFHLYHISSECNQVPTGAAVFIH